MKKFISIAFSIVLLFVFIPNSTAAAEAEDIYTHNLNIYDSQPKDPAFFEFYKLPSKTDEVKSGDEKIIELAESITQNISDGYVKAKAIHDWVSDNIYFDRDSVVSDDTHWKENYALNVLETKRAICAGYAYLTVALLRAAGIPARYVEGFALGIGGTESADIFYDLNDNSRNHAWCEAYVDGRWIIMDVTWNSANKYENGEYIKSPGKDKYFDISLKDISATHRYADYSFDFSLFDLSGLESITIPDGMEVIGDYSFSGCKNLKEIIIPYGVKSIGRAAFAGCVNLRAVNLPESVESIQNAAFENCASLTEIILPESVTEIGGAAFYDCTDLQTITLPSDIKIIGTKTFYNCVSLTNIVIPESVVGIGNSAFYNCITLTELIIPERVKSIDSKAFKNCKNLLNITLPNRINRISDYTFHGCEGLTSVVIPDNVIHIGDRAFGDCINLADITIPASVTGLGRFGTIIMGDNVVNIKADKVIYDAYPTFEGCDKDKLTIYGEAGSLAEKYAENSGIKFIAGAAPVPEIPVIIERTAAATEEITTGPAKTEISEEDNNSRLPLLIIAAAGLIFIGFVIKNKK